MHYFKSVLRQKLNNSQVPSLKLEGNTDYDKKTMFEQEIPFEMWTIKNYQETN